MRDFSEYGEVYNSIVKVLEGYAFVQQENGDMDREEPWYSFPVEELINIKSVMQFQIRWNYIINPES